VHGRSKQPIPPTRTVIKDLIRELEWEGPERWARVIESLRRML
jgi:hypothetical protein